MGIDLKTAQDTLVDYGDFLKKNPGMDSADKQEALTVMQQVVDSAAAHQGNDSVMSSVHTMLLKGGAYITAEPPTRVVLDYQGNTRRSTLPEPIDRHREALVGAIKATVAAVKTANTSANTAVSAVKDTMRQQAEAKANSPEVAHPSTIPSPKPNNNRPG